jgi:hypothetical protein
VGWRGGVWAVTPAPEAVTPQAAPGQVADSASGAEFPDEAAEASEEEDLEELEWRMQRTRQVPPCPQAAPGQRQLQAVNANDPLECTELVAWACEVMDLPVGELFQNMLSDVVREPGALSRLIEEAWQAFLLFLPDERMGVNAAWAAQLGHAMEILRRWAANAEAAIARTTRFLDGQGLTLRCHCQKCLTFFCQIAKCPGCNGTKGPRGRPVHHNSNLHPAFGSMMAGPKRSNSLALWPHALMLMAHGAHPDDAAQGAIHHQIQQDDLQQTQLAIEESFAAQTRKAKQEIVELELLGLPRVLDLPRYRRPRPSSSALPRTAFFQSGSTAYRVFDKSHYRVTRLFRR